MTTANRILLTLLIIVLILSSLPMTALGAHNKQVIMVLINQVNYDDLLEMDTVSEIIDKGAIGLMNTRTAGSAITPKAYTTIGAGVRAEGNWITSAAYNVTEENKKIYETRTGKKAPESGIINLDINKLIAYNQLGEYGAIPGQLGNLIRDAGYKTAAYGNMDTHSETRSPHVLIGMDHWGRIDQGDVSHQVLIEDNGFPGGLRTNYGKIYREIIKNENSPALTIVETGDISRLEEERENLSYEMYELHRQKILKEMNSFIQDIKDFVDREKSLLFIVTPFAKDSDIKEKYQLTPLILYGDGIEAGLLRSDTTRRDGIIGNVDIAPTILEYLDIEISHMIGRPVEVKPLKDNIDVLFEINEFTVATSKNRLPVLTTFAFYQMVLLIVALFVVLFGSKLKFWVYPIIKNLILSGMVIPIVLLYLPTLKVKSLTLTIVSIILFTLILTLATYKIGEKIRNPILPIILVSLLMTLGLMGDIILGSPMIRSSLLGYDPIIGARYYGVGNEYMGVLIGSGLVMFLSLKELYEIPRGLIIILLLAMTIVIGYPYWGANVGGTITAMAATAFVLLRIYRIRIGMKQILYGALGIVAMVAIMGIVDMLLLDSQSHLAGAISTIKEGGITAVFTIISRKLAMNIRLFGVTIWSKVLVVTLIVFAILFYRPYGEIKKLFDKYPYLSIGWAAIVVASITGFMVNDSGVVAAATCLIYLSFSLLYTLIREPHSQ